MADGMNVFTASFFGHRQVDMPLIIEKRLEKVVRELLLTKRYVEFLVGRDGEFDRMAAAAIRRCRKVVRDDNSALVLVLPYVTAEYRNNENEFLHYYDEVEICSASAGKHFKSAHQIRNRSMVDRSDLVVFYVQHPSGGAYRTLRYASEQGIRRINLSEPNASDCKQ